MKQLKKILIIIGACASVSACADSPIGANMNQYEFCSKHASIAMRECMDVRQGVNASLLADQISSSHESQFAQSLDLTALTMSSNEYCNPLSVRKVVFLNCMHMAPPSATDNATASDNAAAACPEGYVCKKETP